MMPMPDINGFLIDPRTESDLREDIRRLAKSYVPEWAFDTSDPDIGSVLALLFASQMAGNIRRLNQVVDKYHTEFINLLDLSLKAAYPAAGVAVFELIPDTVDGVNVPRGVKLLAQGEGEERVVFETQQDVFVSNSILTDIIGVCSESICPLRGDWKEQPLVEWQREMTETPIDIDLEEPAPVVQEQPIKLFDNSGDNIARSALVLYHNSLFDTAEGVSVSVYAKDAQTGQSLASWLSDPANCRWSYLSADGLKPMEARAAADGGVVLEKGGENEHVRLDGEEYAVLCAETIGMPACAVECRSLEVSSSCEPTPPDCVVHNDEQLDTENCLPFGSVASIFDEC